MNVGSVFSGIGGIDLGLERAGFEIAWMCEINPYDREVLAQHWSGIPIHEDITKLTNPKKVNVLAGGFPCQDISEAGKRAGIDGEKSGLWFEFGRVISIVRPQYVIVENVGALTRRGLDRVLGGLAALRYDAEWRIIPASSVGAPHKRERVFIVAYPHRAGLEEWEVFGEDAGEKLQTIDRGCVEQGQGCEWVSEPAVGRMVDGFLTDLDKDRIAALGNAVVPQVAQFVGECVKAHAIRIGAWK